MMSPELMTAVFKMIAVLLVIIGGLLALTKYAKRFVKGGLGGGGGKRLQMLESMPIGLKKSVALIKVPGAVLVLGVTSDRISLLDRMEGDDYAGLADAKEQAPFASFQDQLRKVTGAWQRRQAQAGPGVPVDSEPC